MCIPFDIFIYMSRCFLIFWMVLDGFCLASQCGMAKHRQKHAEKFAEIRQVCHKLFQRVIPQNNFWYLAHLSSRQSGIQLRIIPGGHPWYGISILYNSSIQFIYVHINLLGLSPSNAILSRFCRRLALEIQAFRRGPLCCDIYGKWPELVKLATGSFGFGQAMA